jgi:4-hydroxy-tetrahydrodipicolinate reductase
MSKTSRKNLKSTLRIALVGAAGRMGQEIQGLAPGVQGVVVAQIDQTKDWDTCRAEEIDLVLDFSSPAGLAEALKWCVAQRKALVSGTTGWPAEFHARLLQASRKIPVLYSANMSLGIAVLTMMLNGFDALEGWDFQIEEAHHSQKKDKPSGTALLLQRKLMAVTKKRLPEPQSIRGGGIAGIHQIWAMGPDEAIVIQHTAFNRKVFAQGALHAARWLFDKKEPGLYDLSDLYKKS